MLILCQQPKYQRLLSPGQLIHFSVSTILFQCYKINKEEKGNKRKPADRNASGKQRRPSPAGGEYPNVRNKCKPVHCVLEGSNKLDSPPEATKQVDLRRHAITPYLLPSCSLLLVKKKKIPIRHHAWIQIGGHYKVEDLKGSLLRPTNN